MAATSFNLTDLGIVYTTLFNEAVTPFATDTLTWVYDRGDGTYTVLESFETGSDPNQVLKVLTGNEDPTLTFSRVVFQHPINMTLDDIGDNIVIDGLTNASPELQGIQVVTNVSVDGNWVEVDVIGSVGFDFTSDPTNAPYVRILARNDSQRWLIWKRNRCLPSRRYSLD